MNCARAIPRPIRGWMASRSTRLRRLLPHRLRTHLLRRRLRTLLPLRRSLRFRQMLRLRLLLRMLRMSRPRP